MEQKAKISVEQEMRVAMSAVIPREVCSDQWGRPILLVTGLLKN